MVVRQELGARNTNRLAAARAVLYDQDSVRCLPLVLTRRTPHATNCIASFRVQKIPPDVVFQRVPVSVRAHIRQGDSSLSFDWHDDPPQEVRSTENIVQCSVGAHDLALLHCSILSLSPHIISFFKTVDECEAHAIEECVRSHSLTAREVAAGLLKELQSTRSFLDLASPTWRRSDQCCPIRSPSNRRGP